ncbi:hypothetical protein LguiB_002882 [Lonicera macranthoides]
MMFSPFSVLQSSFSLFSFSENAYEEVEPIDQPQATTEVARKVKLESTSQHGRL